MRVRRLRRGSRRRLRSRAPLPADQPSPALPVGADHVDPTVALAVVAVAARVRERAAVGRPGGLDEGARPRRDRAKPPPAARTVWTCRQSAYAILVPSGDQAGSMAGPSSGGAVAMRRRTTAVCVHHVDRSVADVGDPAVVGRPGGREEVVRRVVGEPDEPAPVGVGREDGGPRIAAGTAASSCEHDPGSRRIRCRRPRGREPAAGAQAATATSTGTSHVRGVCLTGSRRSWG